MLIHETTSGKGSVISFLQSSLEHPITNQVWPQNNKLPKKCIDRSSN